MNEGGECYAYEDGLEFHCGVFVCLFVCFLFAMNHVNCKIKKLEEKKKKKKKSVEAVHNSRTLLIPTYAKRYNAVAHTTLESGGSSLIRIMHVPILHQLCHRLTFHLFYANQASTKDLPRAFQPSAYT
mmetsp:Transcript_1735/g.2612  ORF Transcript_1735/g.2612 Transcript_1735/m.2612 type:complete len:128 (-) Transcript_1735:542-925(-)